MKFDDIVGMMDRVTQVERKLDEGVVSDLAGAVGGAIGTAAGAVWSVFASIIQSFLSTFERDLHHASRIMGERGRSRRDMEREAAGTEREDRRAAEKLERESQARCHNEAVHTFVDSFNNSKEALSKFKGEVGSIHTAQMTELLEKLKEAHRDQTEAERLAAAGGSPAPAPVPATSPTPAPPTPAPIPPPAPAPAPPLPVEATVREVSRGLSADDQSKIDAAVALMSILTGVGAVELMKMKVDEFKRELARAYTDEDMMNADESRRDIVIDAFHIL